MQADDCPYYIESLSQQDDVLVKSHFLANSKCRDLVRVINKKTGEHVQTVTSRYRDHHHLVYNITVRPEDIWIVTYPKCGTTWTQEIVWNIVNGVQIGRMGDEFLFKRSPFIDWPMIHILDEKPEEFYAKLDQMPSPRIIKTHYPFELLPPKLLDTCKVIFVSRNVKDACVSYYHHNRLFKGTDFDSSFEVFADLYKKNNILQGGYFEMLRSGWSRKGHPNLFIFWYEEIKEDQQLWIKKIMNHVGYSLTEEKIDELCKALTFSNYKKVSSMNKVMRPEFKEGRGEFTRKGEVGDWLNHFDEKTNQEWNVWVRDQLDNIGIQEERVRKLFHIDH